MNDITYVGKHTIIYTVSRHAHESWEFVYCTYGSGTFLFDDRSLDYREGDVVVIPPMTPHSNASADGFQTVWWLGSLPCAYCPMNPLALPFTSPLVIADDSNHFLLDAFNAVFFHFYSDRKETSPLLSVYGDLISCYLAAYRTGNPLTPVVARIENNIIANYADSTYELDAFLHSLPFSYDYLRKLFQKELGVTPHRYLVDKRLKLAAELLVSDANAGARTIADIATLCGFHDPLYFSKMFRKKYGIAPRRYLESRLSEAVPEQDSDRMKVRLD